MEFAPTGELVRFENCYVEEEFHTRTVVVLEGPDGNAVARSNEVPFVYSQAVEVELILGESKPFCRTASGRS